MVTNVNAYVYTDGSWSSKTPGLYAGAFLVYQGTKLMYKDAGCGVKAATMRNVAGELSAVMHAASWLKRNNLSAVIVYDYQGIEKWLTSEWKAKNKFTQAYQKFMRPYLESGIVSFKWTKAHNGDLGNELADKEAIKALKNNKVWNRV